MSMIQGFRENVWLREVRTCVTASLTAFLLDWGAPGEFGWEQASNSNKEPVSCKNGQLKGRVFWGQDDTASVSAVLCKLPLCRQAWLSSAGCILIF